jgi:hypothetical protein
MLQQSFARLDDALIERVFQPLSDLIMQRFGLDRLRAACFCLDGASLAWILSQAGALGNAATGWHATQLCWRAVMLVLGLMAMSSLRSLFQRMAGRRAANPLRSAMAPHRCLALAMLLAQLVDIGSLAGWAALAMLGLVVVGMYFSACLPRPPLHRRAARLADAKA